MKVYGLFARVLRQVAALKHVFTPRRTRHVGLYWQLDGLGAVIKEDHVVFFADEVGLRICSCVLGVSATTFEVMFVLVFLLLALVLDRDGVVLVEGFRRLGKVFVQIKFGVVEGQLGGLKAGHLHLIHLIVYLLLCLPYPVGRHLVEIGVFAEELGRLSLFFPRHGAEIVVHRVYPVDIFVDAEATAHTLRVMRLLFDYYLGGPLDFYVGIIAVSGALHPEFVNALHLELFFEELAILFSVQSSFSRCKCLGFGRHFTFLTWGSRSHLVLFGFHLKYNINLNLEKL